MLVMTLKYINKETLDKYAELGGMGGEMFGDILLKAMGYNASCILFCKCSRDDESYNIGWCLENGEQYVKTFSLHELTNALKDKTLELSYDVK